MTINDKTKIFDGSSGTFMLDLVGNGDAPLACKEVALNLESGSVSVKGKVLDDDTAQSVGLVKLADLSIVTEASEAGAYLIPTQAFDRLEITGTSATATIKTLY